MVRVSSAAIAAVLALTAGGAAVSAFAGDASSGLPLSGLAAPVQAAAAPPTITQMAAFPTVSGFTVSPDGRHIAALEGRGEDRVILVWDTTNFSRQPTVVGAAEMKIQSVTFVKNDVLGVSLWQPFNYDADNKIFLGKFMLTDLAGQHWRDPMTVLRTRSEGEAEWARTASPGLLDVLPNDPDNILLTVGADVYRLNVHNNRSERIQRSGERTLGYDVDLNGALRVRNILDRDADGLYVATQFRNASGGWDEHIRSHVKDREVFSIAGFTADPNIAYVISNRGRDKAAIFEYNIATRQLGELAFEHPLFEATGVTVDRRKGPNFGHVLSFTYDGPRETSYAIAPDYDALQKGVEQALGVSRTPLRVTDPATGRTRTIAFDNDRYVDIRAASDDLNVAVVWAGGVNDPGQYYLLRNKTDLTPLAKPYPTVDPATLGTTSLVYYKARDGLDIPAFLSKPPASFGPGPFPTVIMPHGGPWSRDEMSWDGSWWRQLLTSRGYAVLQPQFRGSDGWGKHLWTAGDNEWGQKMQDDLDDGARWLTDTGVAVQGRIAVYGFSYGGYAAMTAAVRPNGLYKCAIAGAGVSDLSKIRSSMFQNPYTREAQRDTVSGLSPVTRAGQIEIPIMVFHGDRDTTVELEQSAAFVRAARNSGQDVQYHVLQDYAHGPAWLRTTEAEQLGYLEDYLKTGCGGGGL